MKLTAVLLTILSLQVSAAGNAQKLTMKLRNVPLERVFSEIKKQTGYAFFYERSLLNRKDKVSVTIQDASLEEVLGMALKSNRLSYNIVGKTIVLTEGRAPVVVQDVARKAAAAAVIRVTGTVTDSTGKPLEGASIKIKGSNQGVSADANGNFIIEVPDRGTVLEVSYVGFETLEQAVSSGGHIQLVLRPKADKGEEVLVIGYGRQRKTSVVSSISTVKGSDISFPTRNLSNNLAGQVAGLISIQRSGEPGYDNSEFWIRGISTFAGGTSPLVLVDGVPRAINDIEPDEIETFSILKDAAATAVYGAEGANGVVLITSKRGRAQKPVISFRTEHSLSQPTRLPKFVGSADYLSLFNEALVNDADQPIYSDELIEKYRSNADPDLYPNTDWMGSLLKKTTNNHRYTVNVRGGSDRARYFVSGAYYTEGGIFKDDPSELYETNIGLKRFNLRSNIDLDVSKTTTVGVDLSGQYLLTNYPGTGTGTIFRQMLITPPYVFPPVYSDGTIATFEKERDANMRNPYNMLMNSGYAKEWRSGIQSNVKIEQRLPFITEGLWFRGQASYDYNGNFYSRRNYNPSRYFATGRDIDGKLIFSRTYSGTPDLSDPEERFDASKNVYIESSINYNRRFGSHTVGAMALYMQKDQQYHDEALAFRKQGMVGRITYSFDNRYFIEGNFGYTGSEAFATGYRFGFFPAVGIGYQISNESFYPEALKDYVNSLKFRVSMGRTGNDNTGTARFLYRPVINMGAAGFNRGITSGGGSNGLGAGIVEGRFEAPYLSWEIEDKQNYGVNIELFKNKVEIIADYFFSERSAILLQRRTVPASAGFRVAPWQNYGRVENSGFDGSINVNHRIGDVNISARGTYTFARNKITEYDELPQPYPWLNITGTRVSENTLYIAERLYTDDDFIITTNPNGTKSYTLKDHLPKSTLGGLVGPGDIKYKDLDGNGSIDAFDRQRGVGNPYNPEIVYGFGLNLEYKGIYVSSFLQGTGNTSVVLGGSTPEGWFPFSWGVDQSNYRTFALDRWTAENPRQDALMPRIHSKSQNAQNNNVASTWWLRNGSFLRLKNVEVGYNVSKSLLRRYKIQSARIYLMGYNLAVWDDIKHWDPETGNGNAGFNYPLARTFTLGVEFSF